MKTRQSYRIFLRVCFAVMLTCTMLLSYQPAQASIYTVTTTADSGPGSLRAAISDANLNPGPHTIRFNIGGCGSVCVIQPATPLPSLTMDGITIDGYTQPGSAPASAGTEATILIELDGSITIVGNGLEVTSSNNVIRGLSIHRFLGNGIAIGAQDDRLANGNRVEGNYLGLPAGGSEPQGNLLYGVFIGLGAQDNIVGGETPAVRNIISANLGVGVGIHGAGTSGNMVMGNYIGAHIDGAGGLENGLDGVLIYGGSSGNIIGGDTAAKRNLLSGNKRDGVRIMGVGSDDNLVIGNHIGVDVSGVGTLENQENGVHILGGAQNNTIGGNSPAQRNVISANLENGILLSDVGTTNTTISGNYIGLAADGDLVLGNGYSGIEVKNGVSDFIIGGDEPGERNVISGNADYGLAIHSVDTHTFVISSNYVGTDASGRLDRGNASSGVHIYSGAHNGLVGGDSPGERNVISGNEEEGIYIWGGPAGVGDVIISGNYVGLAADGASGLGNSGDGVTLSVYAFDITIGGDLATQGNVISANGGHGVNLGGADVTQNSVMGNIIGSDASGLLDLGNGQNGIKIGNSAYENVIGPGNLIVHNLADGVRVDSPGAVGNAISQNSIYSNSLAGIQLSDGGNNEIPAPQIDNVSLGPLEISGTACPACLVELFASMDDQGEGQYFLGSVTAQASTGEYSLEIGYLPGSYLTATATDASNGTSEFSPVYETTIHSLLLPYIGG